MVLDFGTKSLFRPSGLEQDTGVLSERWGQDGSTIKNFSVSLAADATVYTVPTGYRLFIDTVESAATTAGNSYLRDGGSGGTVKIQIYIAANSTVPIPIKTPLYFDTDLYLDVSAGHTGFITLTGWIERLP